MSFSVMVKDGRGVKLQTGGMKNTVKQAVRILGCKKSDLHFITVATASGEGFDAYLFDGSKADTAYWLAAIKPTTEVLASGAVPQ